MIPRPHELHLDLTKTQAAALFITLKKLKHIGPETGFVYHQLEQYLFSSVGIQELDDLENRHEKGEL